MRSPPPRSGRSVLAVTLFLAAFVVLLLAVSYGFLLPALTVVHDASPEYKRRLQAMAWLLMAVVLFVLFAGLFLAFRPGRFFFPRKAGPRTRTTYVDAWEEAGRRLNGGDAGDRATDSPPDEA